QSSVAAADELAAKVRVLAPPRATDDAVLRVVEEAVVQSRVLELHYVDAEGRATMRVIEPAGFYGGSGRWQLVPWCRTRDDSRFFRLDRSTAARLTDEAVTDRSFWEPRHGEWLRLAAGSAAK